MATRTPKLALALALAAALSFAAPAAFASEASDAHKQLLEKRKAAKSEKDKDKRAELETEILAFCKERSDALKTQKLSRMDTCYLGLIQSAAGLHDDAVATCKAAVESKEETKYGTFIHISYVDVLVAKGDVDAAAAECEKMRTAYEGQKEVKVAFGNVGMAMRKAKQYEKSAKLLETAVELGTWEFVKTVVNNWLLVGNKERAVAIANVAVEKGPPAIKEDMQVVADFAAKVGTKIDLPKFDGFVPPTEPPLEGKVVVLAAWNLSARTTERTLKVLDMVKSGFGDDVACLAVTTYYKKNAETGKLDESVTPEQERAWGSTIRDNFTYGGRMAWFPSEADMKSIGVAALPYFCVIGKDGTLLFGHTMQFGPDSPDFDILGDVIKAALK